MAERTRIPKKLLADLEEAAEKLRRDYDRRSERVDEALNGPARLYLDSWVLPQMERVIRWAHGENLEWWERQE